MSDGAVDWDKLRAADIIAGVRQIVEIVMQIDYRELEFALRLAWDDPATTERERQVLAAFHKFRYELERERLFEIAETRDEAKRLIIEARQKSLVAKLYGGGEGLDLMKILRGPEEVNDD